MKTQKEEFLKVLRSYQGIIHKVSLVYFPVPEDREDNFQEVTYRMWKGYSALKNKDKIASWIYAIAINTSISKIRKDSRYVLSDDVELNIASLPIKNDNSIEENIDFKRLLDAIRQLKEVDKSIMLLYVEDYSYNEIGEIIGISTSNVGARINRVKKQLEKLLK